MSPVTITGLAAVTGDPSIAQLVGAVGQVVPDGAAFSRWSERPLIPLATSVSSQDTSYVVSPWVPWLPGSGAVNSLVGGVVSTMWIPENGAVAALPFASVPASVHW